MTTIHYSFNQNEGDEIEDVQERMMEGQMAAKKYKRMNAEYNCWKKDIFFI